MAQPEQPQMAIRRRMRSASRVSKPTETNIQNIRIILAACLRQEWLSERDLMLR
jgi:hypothetical protein